MPKWHKLVGWGLAGLLPVFFVPSAFFKISQPGDFLTEWSKDYPAGAALPIGVVELLVLALYYVPKTRVLGGLLLVGYLGGAVATHVHKADGFFLIPVIIGVIAWASLWLRDPRVRAYLPLT